MVTVDKFHNYCETLKNDLEPFIQSEINQNLLEEEKTAAEAKLINEIRDFITESANAIDISDVSEFTLFSSVLESSQRIWHIYSAIDFCNEEILDPLKCLVHPDAFDMLPKRMAELNKQLNQCYQNMYVLISEVLASTKKENIRTNN